MAGIKFYYRSSKDEGQLTLRLRFRFNKVDKTIDARTKIIVTKDYWKNLHNKKRVSDIEIVNKQNEINKALGELTSFILKAFNQELNPALIDKNWLQTKISEYYNPNNYDNTVPADLVGFINYFILNTDNLTSSRKKKYITIRNKMIRFQESQKFIIYIKDIGLDFLKKFSDYYNKETHQQGTKYKELNFIRFFCKQAHIKGIELHREFDLVKVKDGEAINIYLDTDEIENIKNLKLEDEVLDASRDWLLISCYTGQRVSDFMRFNKEMLREEKNKDGKLITLIEFTQKKTRKLMALPLNENTKSILAKRGGNFPAKISAVKYNLKIKEVCKQAGINEIVEGKLRTKVSNKNENKKSNYRDVAGNYKKYELVTSHIGRRSFATNNYGDMPTSYIMYATGHSTEKQLVQGYMKKKNTDIAKEMIKFMK